MTPSRLPPKSAQRLDSQIPTKKCICSKFFFAFGQDHHTFQTCFSELKRFLQHGICWIGLQIVFGFGGFLYGPLVMGWVVMHANSSNVITTNWSGCNNECKSDSAIFLALDSKIHRKGSSSLDKYQRNSFTFHYFLSPLATLLETP